LNIIIKLFTLLLLSTSLFASHINLTKIEKDWLIQHPILSIGVHSSVEPIVIESKNNVLHGIIPDLYNIIANRLNVKFEYIPDKSMSNAIEKLKNKKIDVIAVIHSSVAKRESFLHLNNPLDFYTTVFAQKNNNLNIYNDDDIKNLRVAYCSEIIYIDKFLQSIKEKQNLTLIKTSTPLEAIKYVADNKADVMIGINADNYTIVNNQISNVKAIITLKNVDSDTSIAVHPDNKIFANILKKATYSLSLKEKNNILKKWFIEDDKLISFTEQEKEYLAKKPYISAMALNNFQPFSFIKDDKALGYSIDSMRLIGKEIGKEIKFINKPWNELLEMIKNDKLDVIPHIAITDERKKFVDYTNFTHLTFLIGFVINKNNDINSMKDFKDKKIAVVDKYYIHDYLKKSFPNIELLVVNSTKEAIEAVAQNRAFAVIDNIPTLNYFMQEKWLSNLKITSVKDFGLPRETEMPMGVTKGNKLLKSILEKAHASIKQDEIIKLRQKWLNFSPAKTTQNTLTVEELLYLKNKKTIKICVLPNWLPFEQINEKGKHIGIGADFMKIISKYIDTPVELVATKEWAQSLQNIRDRKCDILPVSMDVPSRRDSMNFTKPYVSEPFVIATKADKPFIKDAKSISNKKIAVVKSYAFIDVLKADNPSIEIIDVANTKEGLQKVSSGELHGYIDTMPTISYSIQKYSMLDLKIAGKLEFDITLSIASRNDEPLLNTIMQKALDTISEEERRTIIGKWIEIKVAQDFDYKLLWQISALFLIIVLIILYKNHVVSKVNGELVTAKYKIEEQQSMVDKYVLILSTNTKGIITDVNEAFCKATGYEKDDLIGKTHSIMRHPGMPEIYFKELWNAIKTNITWIDEIKNYTKEKDTVHFNVYIEPIFDNKTKIGYRAIYEDITDKKRVEELSITDKLTGLYNRLKLDEILLMEIQKFKRYTSNFSIIILDIDDFKSVNDIHGHDVGDHILQTISGVIKTTIRDTDIVGRWGGEEFVVVCANTNLESAYIAAEHIRVSIQNTVHEKVGMKSVSLGVAEFTQDDTLSSIFKKADEALYKAKHSGKNKVIKYS
jgi:diguanylate cyclase (GGDEF)-like protein/PAS domain S-box-containing protein